MGCMNSKTSKRESGNSEAVSKAHNIFKKY